MDTIPVLMGGVLILLLTAICLRVIFDLTKFLFNRFSIPKEFIIPVTVYDIRNFSKRGEITALHCAVARRLVDSKITYVGVNSMVINGKVYDHSPYEEYLYKEQLDYITKHKDLPDGYVLDTIRFNRLL